MLDKNPKTKNSITLPPEPAELHAPRHALLLPTSTTLRMVPLLADMPENQLVALANVASWAQYQPEDMIMRQSEASALVYFVVSGFAKVLRGGCFGDAAQAPGKSEMRSRSRHMVMVALLGPGDIVGEVGTLLDTGRSASIEALTPCQVISLPGRDFLASMQAHPPFAIAVARKMAQRLADADCRIELMRGELKDRIQAMIRHCESLGLDTARWLSKAEIARMVGASRVAVSQIVNRRHSNNANSGSASAKY